MLINNADELLDHALISKKAMDELILEGSEPVEIPPESIWVIDKKSGCYFLGKDLRHTKKCSCGDYDEY
jgi:hypothetical protein